MFKVYKLAKAQREILDSLLADDIVGRQTVTYKDGASYGFDSSYIVLIEGSEDIFRNVDSIAKGALEELPKPKEEDIYRKIKDEENSSRDGLGFIFG
ncbi:hypothetical protein [Ferroplasma sp.]|uniref:hypothetical protein n=1 Tax=Ferroplasma sp. TaxID=2591003 RepID=UPI002609A492|nr:hypothetical protein [Ferroplasma sp.]MCL4453073.1 hypothetical protein [Candidatus Thermoplasmatota archaeon]